MASGLDSCFEYSHTSKGRKRTHHSCSALGLTMKARTSLNFFASEDVYESATDQNFQNSFCFTEIDENATEDGKELARVETNGTASAQSRQIQIALKV